MIRLCAALLGLVIGCVGVAYADEAAEARRLAKASLEAAREGLKNEQFVFRGRELFWWSQCVLLAELELCETPQARLTAFQDHVHRCKDFEAKINDMKRQGQLSIQATLDSRYFRARAEYWLAEEKLAQSQSKTTGDARKDPVRIASPKRGGLSGE
jgi:hypothetical protein